MNELISSVDDALLSKGLRNNPADFCVVFQNLPVSKEICCEETDWICLELNLVRIEEVVAVPVKEVSWVFEVRTSQTTIAMLSRYVLYIVQHRTWLPKPRRSFQSWPSFFKATELISRLKLIENRPIFSYWTIGFWISERDAPKRAWTPPEWVWSLQEKA